MVGSRFHLLDHLCDGIRRTREKCSPCAYEVNDAAKVVELLLLFQKLLQVDNICPHTLHRWIDAQGMPEALKRRRVVSDARLALAKSCRRSKMKGIQIQSAPTIGDRFEVSLQHDVCDCALIPRFRKSPVLFDQSSRCTTGRV